MVATARSGDEMPHKIYNVRPGDTLTGIARAAAVSYRDLLGLNPQLVDPNVIFPGDAILLPEAASRSDLLKTVAADVYPEAREPLWLKIARRELGTAERSNGSNPRILEYLATTTLPAGSRGTDETPWCAAFVNWCLETAGINGLDSAWALSWRTFGVAVEAPEPGDITVFKRPGGGHVGFFLRDLGAKVEILGGNQGNSVSIRSYPKDGPLFKGGGRYELVAVRRPG